VYFQNNAFGDLWRQSNTIACAASTPCSFSHCNVGTVYIGNITGGFYCSQCPATAPFDPATLLCTVGPFPALMGLYSNGLPHASGAARTPSPQHASVVL
jgi:hypothetical protein